MNIENYQGFSSDSVVLVTCPMVKGPGKSSSN